MIPISVLREYMPKLKDEDLKELGPVEYDQSKVPEVSKKHAENVRRKVYLPDMTESFARGVEYAGLIASEAVDISDETKERQDTVETQFNSVQQELTDKDPISAPEIIVARGGEPTLSARLEKEKNEINAQLAQIVRPEIEINVLNPPKETDLLPLTMSDPTEDQLRLQAIFDYVKANEVSYKPNNQQMTGYSYTVYFPKGIYEWSSSVLAHGNYLIIKGDRAIIRVTDGNYAFKTTGTDGWKLDLDGFSFDRCNAISQQNDNLEAGRTNIVNCWFYYSKRALDLIKQSSHTYIDKCHFYKCEEVGSFELTDAVYFDKVWINDAGRTIEHPEVIINKTRMYFNDVFFIPSGVTHPVASDEIAWVRNEYFVRFENCRFSAEPGAMTVVNQYGTAGQQAGYNPTGAEILNSEPLASTTGKYVIRLFAMANVLKVSGNQIGPLDTSPIGFSKTYTGLDIDAFAGRYDLVTVDVSGNVGQSSGAWTVPVKLKQFIRIDDLGFKNDSGIVSAKSGTATAANKFFMIDTSFNRSDAKIAEKVYQVKITAQPAGTSDQIYSSVYVGLIGFRITNSSGNYTLESLITTIYQNNGGTTTSNTIGTPISIRPEFANNNSTSLPLITGSTEKISIKVIWQSPISGKGLSYEVREIMEAR